MKDRSSLFNIVRLMVLYSVALCGVTDVYSTAYAQSCNSSENVSFSFTSPPKIDILESDSARWSTDAAIRFAYFGEWCPIPEDITFEDEMGSPIPAVVYFRVNTQLVENGPLSPQIGLIKPLMSLEMSTDYTLILSPPNPALALYSDYTLNFRTSRAALAVDYDLFEGVKTVEIDGNLCEGEGLYLSDSENFDCIVPSFLQLKVSFKALPNHEVSYLVYRVSSTPSDPNASLDLVDDVERPVAFLPGVSEERSQRSVEVRFPVLYAPFPRTECFKVVALDEWGRERAGLNEVVCTTLGKPDACADAQFPEPNPFENTPPIEGRYCDTIGINGASASTPIPQIMEEEPMEEEPMEEEPMETTNNEEDSGCQQRSQSMSTFSVLMGALLLIILIRVRSKQKRVVPVV